MAECVMKLKVEDVVIPNLTSLYQSFNSENDYKSSVVASFCDLVDMDALVAGIKDLTFTQVAVLNEADETIATADVTKLKSVDRNVMNDQITVQISFL